mmetsp:Transcript_25838/g.70957  ORF Transcript_25838/g.70957 Transcript_25838/m.70957 type:complete len:816 (-) Transcript_25838:577-3024(-)
MVAKFPNVSLKRHGSLPTLPPDPSEESTSETLSQSLDSQERGPLHQKLPDIDDMIFRSIVKAKWFTPRPVIASILNNKAVIYMERHQYEEARRSLHRALRLVEKENKAGTCKTNDHESTAHPENKPKANSVKNIVNYDDSSSVFDCKRSYSPSVEVSFDSRGYSDGSSSSNTREEEKTASDDIAATVETSCTPFDYVFDDDDRSNANNPTNKMMSHATKVTQTRNEYDEGMDCFKSPFRLFHNSSRSLDGTVLFNLGRVAHDQGNLEDALGLFKRSLLAIKNCSARDEALTLAVLVGIGKIQYMKGGHVDSLNTYMTALALAQSHYGENSVEVAACLNCIGVLHYMMATGDNDIALDALQTSLRQRLKILGKDHIDVGTGWNNIGRMYFQLGKYDLALEAYLEALRIRRKCQGDSVDVAATLFNCGQVYHNMERRDKAISLFQEFLKLAKIHFGEFHRDICIVTTCIGQILHENKDYEKALKSFQYALRIGNIALGPVHSEIAITLNKMGNVYYETGDLDSALKVYHQGLDIELTVLEPANPNIYVTYTNIAEIHKQKGEYGKAIEYYQKVYEIQISQGAPSSEIANTLGSIGYTKQQMEDLDGALEANQECLRLRRDTYGDVHEEVAVTLTHTALVLLKLERHGIALQAFAEAYRIRKSLPDPDQSMLAFTIYNIALIYHHLGSHEQALKFYLATAEIEKNGLGIANRDLSITYYNIGQIFYQRGDMKRALAKFKEALEIERECYGAKHPTCARTLNEIGNIEMQLGNLDAMMECYSNALRIYKEVGMVNESVVVYGLRLWRFDVVHPEAAAAA